MQAFDGPSLTSVELGDRQLYKDGNAWHFSAMDSVQRFAFCGSFQGLPNMALALQSRPVTSNLTKLKLNHTHGQDQDIQNDSFIQLRHLTQLKKLRLKTFHYKDNTMNTNVLEPYALFERWVFNLPMSILLGFLVVSCARHKQLISIQRCSILVSAEIAGYCSKVHDYKARLCF